MNKEIRIAQIINGEAQPLNHFIGLWSCLRIGEIHDAFQLEDINLHAIPTIQTINDSFTNKSLLKNGSIIGVATPAHELDSPRLIILDRGNLMTMTVDRYQQKVANGIWDTEPSLNIKQYPQNIVSAPKKKEKKKKEKRINGRKRVKGRQLNSHQRMAYR